MNKPLSLMVSTILMILILAVSGCSTFNPNGPTPTPTSTPMPTTTPSPTSTAEDAIVGFWEGSKNSITTTMQFFNDGTLIYNNGGNIAKGHWIKMDKKQYRIGILIADRVVTLNDNMNQFTWEDIVMTKKA